MKYIFRKLNNVNKRMKKSGMSLFIILPFVLSITGCSQRSAVGKSYGGANQLPLLSENVMKVDVISEEEPTDLQPEVICVHVCGAVKKPGVYEMPAGSRVYEAVCIAGGYTLEADRDYVNQAKKLTDADKLVIPTIDETAALTPGEDSAITSFGVNGKGFLEGIEESSTGKININTASIDQLCTLTGIGEARAKAIIDYRTDNGAFSTIEDIMNVSGIKQGSFEKIKNDICVN